ncbi:MAG: cell envelope biogenesis protein LolA [Prevotella sp.]|nr:cell envelope biogenesis protein LolA [Prevotella sp.]
MKKILFSLIILLASTTAMAQKAAEARKILDKTAAVVGYKGGASASFKITSAKIGSTTGTIAIKGKKFHARTPQAIVWFDGKTQWSYMKSTDEVNIFTPTEAQQMAMNPYQFINLYKQGYTLSMTGNDRNFYNIRLVAQNKSRSAQELYIKVNKKTYTPTQVRMREGTTWTTIDISNFQAKTQSDATFVFKAKDFPTAEVIDLR